LSIVVVVAFAILIGIVILIGVEVIVIIVIVVVVVVIQPTAKIMHMPKFGNTYASIRTYWSDTFPCGIIGYMVRFFSIPGTQKIMSLFWKLQIMRSAKLKKLNISSGDHFHWAF
jgi:hypothetical protein